MYEKNLSEEDALKMIQKFLKTPPVIIWGSGATVAYGMPTMNDLNNLLKKKFTFFDKENTNLEEELGKTKYENHLMEIRKEIWKSISIKDDEAEKKMLCDLNYTCGIKKMIKKFLEPFPYSLSIITTNYDRVLENAMSLSNINFTDGFKGRRLSLFEPEQLNYTNTSNNSNISIVKLLKVHGSLNWFKIDGEIRYFNKNNIYEPEIIPPGKNKYKEAFNEPYRTLISKADEIITNAKAFLIVGFGFNDEHITPKIITMAKRGSPIILITKAVTESTKNSLKDAQNYIFIEEDKNESRITIKKNNKTDTLNSDKNLWQIDTFMEVFE